MAQNVQMYSYGLTFRVYSGDDELLKQMGSGEKTIETRVYKLPKAMCNQTVLMIQTTGESKQTRAVGEIVFSHYKTYKTRKEFYDDSDEHQIWEFDGDSPWKWESNGEKVKYGWKIARVVLWESHYKLTRKPAITISRNVGIIVD